MFAGSGSVVAGRGSMVAVRGSRFVGGSSRFTVRGWRFAGRSSRSRRSDATLSSRGTYVCYADVRAVWYVFHVVISAVRGSVAQQAPHYFRAERPLWGRSGGVVSSATCIRLTSFPTFSPCRSTRIVEGPEWERTPAPPHGGLLARIKGPGRRYTGVCVELTPGSPLSRGVSRCRSARPRYRYLHNGCCIRGGVFLH